MKVAIIYDFVAYIIVSLQIFKFWIAVFNAFSFLSNPYIFLIDILSSRHKWLL